MYKIYFFKVLIDFFKKRELTLKDLDQNKKIQALKMTNIFGEGIDRPKAYTGQNKLRILS